MTQDSKTACQVKIRLTPALRDWLKHQAINNHRTLTREIEHRVSESQKRDEAQGATQ
ncbi:hypothetical protein D3C71_1059050 [compost metagenome]